MKILDYQGLTLGHPAMDIWTIVYSATDAEYRAEHLENDLKAYYEVFSTYMDTTVDYAEFRKEVEERRIYGLVMFGEFYINIMSPSCSIIYPSGNMQSFISRKFLLHDAEPHEASEPNQGDVQVLGGVQ